MLNNSVDRSQSQVLGHTGCVRKQQLEPDMEQQTGSK